MHVGRERDLAIREDYRVEVACHVFSHVSAIDPAANGALRFVGQTPVISSKPDRPWLTRCRGVVKLQASAAASAASDDRHCSPARDGTAHKVAASDLSVEVSWNPRG
jgi:hypothetical protein